MTIQEQIDEALELGDAKKLDQALRAEYHFKHRGISVDTTNMQFDLVRKLDPHYYDNFVFV